MDIKKLVKTIEFTKNAQTQTRRELTKKGVEAIEEFASTLDLTKKISPYGLGSGAYTEVKQIMEKKISYMNGLPYIQIDVLVFTFQGNQYPMDYTKSYLKGIGHQFNESIDSPTTLKCRNMVEFTLHRGK
jgi:hypothetical protein